MQARSYEPNDVPAAPEEVAAIDESRKHKRMVGLAALLIMALPTIVYIIFKFLQAAIH